MTVSDIIRDLLAKHEVSANEAAKWAGIAQSTFSMKMKNNTFYAEEAQERSLKGSELRSS